MNYHLVVSNYKTQNVMFVVQLMKNTHYLKTPTVTMW